MKLSEVIKKFREDNRLSQREFAKMCGLSNSLISILEMGTNPQTGKVMDPDMRTYRRIADGMGITVDELFAMIKADAPADLPGLSESDREIIEVLHQNPQLRLLLSIQMGLRPKSLDAVTAIVKEIAKERGDDD